ncbi:hypothetical protein NUW58_g1922 [Xylaria curta]|uniref:Uncharacterized protein n=1 Tax=Xylaria curta TaxID=42375 RepID=A0ACC1PI60_9PEZI|nr:hypothetical protein NUW58_g1922 [Xylaria curta]
MATAAAEAAAGGLLKTFRTGTKQVFLTKQRRCQLDWANGLPISQIRPSHMITFLAPRANQPPTFATFKVPLTFNKFDLRDYLFHAYRTPVLGVRSQLRQQRVRRSKVHGRIYRPPPIKTMTVQLTQPFVWPRVPTDIKPWKKPSAAKMKAQEKRNHTYQSRISKTGFMPLRDEMKESQSRKDLKKEAKRLLKDGEWTNNRELDPRFSKETDVKRR